LYLYQETPFVTDSIKGNNSFKGVARTILGVFREVLGFDWELVFPEDNCVGYVDENGEASGVMKLLLEGVS